MTGDEQYPSCGRAEAARGHEDTGPAAAAGHRSAGGGERGLAEVWAEALGVPFEPVRGGDRRREDGTRRAATRLVTAPWQRCAESSGG
ncbi:hypothetical protein [Streptomyces resistomycificus]|uniref:Uncharacterized protein n=1 Tax=Streptomyces resistomycificus TaxID=67356 RepID=A0A0L8L305_9ACTN|nr:hypothetical protein [Streptomyces resistomycificus]KOG32618.1 hypothetical protein ADK37_26485 [Streptomyces resistomycificus]KUN90557.1 hypothetical protein AQJ84_39580 [Streptomyces resistomycificus]